MPSLDNRNNAQHYHTYLIERDNTLSPKNPNDYACQYQPSSQGVEIRTVFDAESQPVTAIPVS
jgi:hypothetical protein